MCVGGVILERMIAQVLQCVLLLEGAAEGGGCRGGGGV